tara:strand:- start:437 stop:667 length:231 start_codon:yes stop_codon:yes gene_type:complete
LANIIETYGIKIDEGLAMKIFTFKNVLNTDEDEIIYTIPSHSNLLQVCEAFTLFLRACGYNLEGKYIGLQYYDDLK